MVAQRFRGQVVIVTGAGSGIGAALATRFRDEGAHVVGVDLDVGGIPEGCVPVAADVSKEPDVKAYVAEALRQFGHIDVLCNNAGIGSTTDVVASTIEEWDHVFAVNARGTFLGIRAVIPSMLERRHGVIINTSSIAALAGLPDRASYSASKGAVSALSRQVAVQYAKMGIRCNSICPGTVDSPWVGRLLQNSEDASVARAQLITRQPMGRLATPQEVAGAAAYLASEEAAFITGVDFPIDGGLLAR